MTRVLFVCMGNICRSPTAEGVFRHQLAARGLTGGIEADSAGTHAYHAGEPPDRRSSEVALGRGVDLSRQRARQVEDADFEAFDHIFAMDRANLDGLRRRCPPHLQHKLRLFLELAPHLGVQEVPDPYYGGPNGFDVVFDQIEAASTALIDELTAG